MSKTSIIITRDKEGTIALWSPNTRVTRSTAGNWYALPPNGSIGFQVFSTAIAIKHFRRIFGFFPRKGSRGVFEGRYKEDGTC